jgi:transcription initiation factor TFIIB
MEKKAGLKKGGKCPECGAQSFIQDEESGEIACSSCGLVVTEQMMDTGPEWRAFNQEEKEKRTRVGAPENPLIHDKGLSTTIKYPDRDAHGRRLPISVRNKMWRLRKWQWRSKMNSSTGRNLAAALTEMTRLGKILNIPEIVIKEAAIIYRKALLKELVRGRSISGIVGASIRIACRIWQVITSAGEIAEKSTTTEKEINRNYRLLIRKLKLNIPLPDHSPFIEKIGGQLNISHESKQLASKILKEAERKKRTGGKGPRGLAAAALYIACLQNEEKITQKEIAVVSLVTEVTIRNRYQGLKKGMKLDKICQNILHISDYLSIPKPTENKAISIANQTFNKDLLLSKKNKDLILKEKIDVLVLIILYTACRLDQVPLRAIKAFLERKGISEKEILEGFNRLVQGLNLKIPDAVDSLFQQNLEIYMKTSDIAIETQ